MSLRIIIIIISSSSSSSSNDSRGGGFGIIIIIIIIIPRPLSSSSSSSTCICSSSGGGSGSCGGRVDGCGDGGDCDSLKCVVVRCFYHHQMSFLPVFNIHSTAGPSQPPPRPFSLCIHETRQIAASYLVRCTVSQNISHKCLK